VLQLPEKSSKIERLTHGMWIDVGRLKPGDLFSEQLGKRVDYGMCLSIEHSMKDDNPIVHVFYLRQNRIHELWWSRGITVMIP